MNSSWTIYAFFKKSKYCTCTEKKSKNATYKVLFCTEAVVTQVAKITTTLWQHSRHALLRMCTGQELVHNTESTLLDSAITNISYKVYTCIIYKE